MRTANRSAPPASQSALLLLLAGLMLLAGCRTYGRYDATEKMLPEMRQAVQLFASDLERARSSYDMLQREAQGDSVLGIVASEYEQAVAAHEEILSQNREMVAAFEDDLPSYRRMHRAYGAMLSLQQTARNRYRSLTKAVRYPGVTTRMDPGANRRAGTRRRAIPDTAARARADNFTEGRYYIAPLFYERLQSAGSNMTMRQALAERSQRQSQRGRLMPSSAEGSALGTPPPADSAGRVSR